MGKYECRAHAPSLWVAIDPMWSIIRNNLSSLIKSCDQYYMHIILTPICPIIGYTHGVLDRYRMSLVTWILIIGLE